MKLQVISGYTTNMAVFRQKFAKPPLQRGLVFNLREEVGPAEKSTGATTLRRRPQQEPRSFLFFAYYTLGGFSKLEGVALADEQANILCGFDCEFVTSLSADQVRTQLSFLCGRDNVDLAKPRMAEAIGLGPDGRCYFRPDADVDFGPVNDLKREATGVFFDAPDNPFTWEDLDNAWLITIEYLRTNVRRFMHDRDVVLDYKGQPRFRFRNPMTVESPIPLFGGTEQTVELTGLDECFWLNTTPEALAAQRAAEAARQVEQKAEIARCQEDRLGQKRKHFDTKFKHIVLANAPNYPTNLIDYLKRMFIAYSGTDTWLLSQLVKFEIKSERGEEKTLKAVVPRDFTSPFAHLSIDAGVWSRNLDWVQLVRLLKEKEEFEYLGVPDTKHINLKDLLNWFGSQAHLYIYFDDLSVGGQEEKDQLVFEFYIPEQKKQAKVYSGWLPLSKVQDFTGWRFFFDQEGERVKPKRDIELQKILLRLSDANKRNLERLLQDHRITLDIEEIDLPELSCFYRFTGQRPGLNEVDDQAIARLASRYGWR